MADNNKFWDNFFKSEGEDTPSESPVPEDTPQENAPTTNIPLENVPLDTLSDDTTVVPSGDEVDASGFRDFNFAEEDPFPLTPAPAAGAARPPTGPTWSSRRTARCPSAPGTRSGAMT